MKTAILLLGYKKIQVFTQVVQALSKQTKKFDLFVKLDNCGDQDYSNRLIGVVREYFPQADITLRDRRYTVELQIVCSLNQMFQAGYDRVFYTQDDVIYEPTALETLENLMDWTDKNMQGVSIVQSWNYNLTEQPHLSEYIKLHGLENLWYKASGAENQIGYTGQNYWGALFSKKCWDACGPIIMTHYNLLLDNNDALFNFMLQMFSMLVYSNVSDDVKARLISRFNMTCWQGILDVAMAVNNQYKVCLTNPRSKTIGVTGSSSTWDMFHKVGLDKIITNSSQMIPTEFILNKESERLWIGK